MASNPSDVVVTGLAELQLQLSQLPANIERKLLRGALRAGQKVVADMARDRAPSAEPSSTAAQKYGAVTGALRSSIRVSARARGGNIVASVKAGNRAAYYAGWVEFGTRPHTIEAKDGGAISFGGKEYKRINHPGAQARPYMRPALDWAASNNSAPFQAVAAYLQRRLAQEGATPDLARLPDEADGPATAANSK